MAITEELSWNDVRDDVKKCNPALSAIIDELPLTKNHTLIKARYPFASKVVHKGTLHIANSNREIVAISHPSIPQTLRQKLSYRSVPTGIVTHNASEVHFKMEQRIISLGLFRPGYIMGLWEVLDPPTSYLAKRIWSVNAGARTMVMVPKITDAESLAILQKEFRIPRAISKDLADHWQIFASIANHPCFKSQWYFEIIYFPEIWVSSLQNKDMQWKLLENYFLHEGWVQSSYWRNKVTYDLIWEIFMYRLSQQLIKPNPYDVCTAKHLGLVGTGVLPGLSPATNDLVAPISGLQDVFVQRYGLKQYVPTILVPDHLSLEKPDSCVYYSLHFPTLLESSPKTRNYPSHITNLREIRHILEKFWKETLNGRLGVEETPIYEFATKLKVDYFHSDAADHDEIRNSAKMPKEDKNLIYYPNKLDGMKFSDKSRFVRGCVKLSVKL